MKIFKVFVASAVLVLSLILCLWALDVIPLAVVEDTAKRMGLLIGILGFASTFIYLLFGVKAGQDRKPPGPNSGPNF